MFWNTDSEDRRPGYLSLKNAMKMLFGMSVINVSCYVELSMLEHWKTQILTYAIFTKFSGDFMNSSREFYSMFQRISSNF